MRRCRASLCAAGILRGRGSEPVACAPTVLFQKGVRRGCAVRFGGPRKDIFWLRSATDVRLQSLHILQPYCNPARLMLDFNLRAGCISG